jgi:hypothetical protein
VASPSVAFSPDDQRLALSNPARIVDVKTGALLAVMTLSGGVRPPAGDGAGPVAWSSKGASLAVAENGGCVVYDCRGRLPSVVRNLTIRTGDWREPDPNALGATWYNLGRVLEARGDRAAEIAVYRTSLGKRLDRTVRDWLVTLDRPPPGPPTRSHPLGSTARTLPWRPCARRSMARAPAATRWRRWRHHQTFAVGCDDKAPQPPRSWSRRLATSPRADLPSRDLRLAGKERQAPARHADAIVAVEMDTAASANVPSSATSLRRPPN